MATTLHLKRGDYTAVSAAADGGLLVELTDDGDRHLVDQHPRRAAALEERAGLREAWLRSLPVEELVALAKAPLGGPDPDVWAEGARRMRDNAERLAPTLEALRSLGLIGAAR